MGLGAIVGGLLGVHSYKQQRKAAKESEKASRLAIEEANKVKANDLLPSTASQTAETAEMGSANRKATRRGKSSLTIDRPDTSFGTTTGTGLNI